MFNSLMALALLPGVLIIIYIFRKDKIEHEPMGLIFKLVIFGALSCIPAVILENLVTVFGPAYIEGTVEYAFFEAFCVAALCEELCKYGLLRLGSWKNRNFDFRFDGIVYGVSVAVGFALLENVLYVMEGGIQVALIRAVMSVPLHAFCGVFMGVFYGAAKKYSIMGLRGKAAAAGWGGFLIPVLIHGIYDALAFMGTLPAEIILLAFVAFMYVIAIKYVNKYAREDWKAGFYTAPLSDMPLDGENQR